MTNSLNVKAITSEKIHNPKRGSESRQGRSGWYKYYAGFSAAFAQDALAASTVGPSEARLLDPWNGSGTTTEVGARCGYDSLGFDINPVMVIVAKARTLQPNVQPSLSSLLEEIVLRTDSLPLVRDADEDPLGAWLSRETVVSMRRIEHSLQTILVDAGRPRALGTLPSLSGISALAAFFYVALFRSLRKILQPFKSSNPTWIKGPGSPAERVNISREQLITLLRGQVTGMAEALAGEAPWQLRESVPSVHLDLASSTSLPLGDRSVGIVVTSPPYCTRIDYVVKTAPELALLGFGDPDSKRRLRDRMIGTPTVTGDCAAPSLEWGRTCVELLDKVSCHRSRASRSYYLKTHTQYFTGLHKSLKEIHRVLADSGECFLVVQDSYYKEIRIDLAQIACEMADGLGWRLLLRRDFPSSRTMVGLNPSARAYSNPRLAVESVLHFSKRGRV